MNPRQRTLNALLFQEVDKVPLTPGEGRKSTRDAWHSQGLPTTIERRHINEYAYCQVGGRELWPVGGEPFPVNERMIPQFEEKVLEVREHSQIVQDWKGNICEIGLEFDTRYLREAIDFVTRRWITCPIESWADWEEMKKRYNPDDPTRFPKDAASQGKALADRNWIVEVNFAGPFWQMREWLGFETLCMKFYDDPDLIRDMIAFWRDHIARLLQNMFHYIVPDIVHFSEDMAYKKYSMISPKMTRQFLLPSYARWGEIIREHGCRIYAMDSDGFIGDLIPIWIEAGINVCDPIEVAAGNDIVAFRRQFGKKMAYRGGIDKRAMAKGGRILEEEIQRITPLVQDGGYIPGCDHGVPSDVSWPNYVEYVKRLAQVTGWL